jgi:hypothetical protein
LENHETITIRGNQTMTQTQPTVDRFIKIISRTTSPFIPEAQQAFTMGLGLMASEGFTWEGLKQFINPDNKQYFKTFFTMGNQTWEEKEKPRTKKTHFTTDPFGFCHHVNPFTNEEFKGKNTVILEAAKQAEGFTSNKWATFLGWTQNGYSLAGTKSKARIEKWKVFQDKNGKDVPRLVKTYAMFNGDQATPIN